MTIPRRSLLAASLLAGVAPAFVRHAGGADLPRFALGNDRAERFALGNDRAERFALGNDRAERFALGVASGAPRADGMVLWTRLVGADLPAAVDVAWEVAEDDAFARIVARGTETATAADAHSVHAEPRGLAPDRWYRYRFRALGQQSQPGRTRTAPAPDASVASLAFALASCQRFDHGHYAAWRHAAAQALDLVVFVGDYIYEYAAVSGRVRMHDGPTVRTLAAYRDRYALYKGDPSLQAAHVACPWLVTWDDHEVENDYAGDHGKSPVEAFRAQRAAAYRAWWEHMPVPKSMRPAGPGLRLFHRVDWGRLARWHLLDNRQYRDPHACAPLFGAGSSQVRASGCAALADPRRSLLGAAQERWLADGWSAAQRWNLVAQQTLMAPLARDEQGRDDALRWTDGWDGYAATRSRLLAGARAQAGGGVVVLGGDIHANVVADLHAVADDERSPVVATEFCGTSIASDGPSQGRMDFLRRANPHIRRAGGDQHGYTRFTVTPRELGAEWMVVDDVLSPASGVRRAARFAVDPAQPGAHAA